MAGVPLHNSVGNAAQAIDGVDRPRVQNRRSKHSHHAARQLRAALWVPDGRNGAVASAGAAWYGAEWWAGHCCLGLGLGGTRPELCDLVSWGADPHPATATTTTTADTTVGYRFIRQPYTCCRPWGVASKPGWQWPGL